MQTRSHRGRAPERPALWLRMLALFCLVMVAIASTAQVCHSHEDAGEAELRVAGTSYGHAATGTDSGPVLLAADAASDAKANVDADSKRRDSKPDSAVRCPLCVAMHSAIPVTVSLQQVALVRLDRLAEAADGIERTFRWRFEMASRPPPAARLFA